MATALVNQVYLNVRISVFHFKYISHVNRDELPLNHAKWQVSNLQETGYK